MDGMDKLIIGGAILFSVLIVGAQMAQPYYEAKHYNSVTGASVTYWDAVWLDLRVQEQPKK